MTNAMSALQARAVALSFLQNLAKEVSEDTVDLPCFPDVVVRISRTLADPHTTSDRLVTIVGAEPRLAARILQTANSAAFNSSGKPLNDLKSAVTRLGQQMIQGTAMSYAMQRVKQEASLRSIEGRLTDLWETSIAVASISKLVAGRAKVSPDQAFLTGLLHGIGKLYVMVRSAALSDQVAGAPAWTDLVAGWQAPIGKAILQSWGFTEEICEAVGNQNDLDRRGKHAATLTDVLIAGVLLAEALKLPAPRNIETQGVNAFSSIGLSSPDCAGILESAEREIRLVREALI